MNQGCLTTERGFMILQLVSALAMGLLFFIVTVTYAGPAGESYTMGQSILYAFVGMVVGFILSFLFTPVAAEAIAIVGVNPVSGMTMITLILSLRNRKTFTHYQLNWIEIVSGFKIPLMFLVTLYIHWNMRDILHTEPSFFNYMNYT